VPGTNKAEIARWIADWGEDSDFVRVRVKGHQQVVHARRGHDAHTIVLLKFRSLDLVSFSGAVAGQARTQGAAMVFIDEGAMGCGGRSDRSTQGGPRHRREHDRPVDRWSRVS